jgi:hypothetical protein
LHKLHSFFKILMILLRSGKEPSALPDDMRSHGTRSQFKATIIKSAGDDSFGPNVHSQ